MLATNRMFNFQQFMGLGGVATYSVQLRAFSAPFFPKYDEQKISELNHGGKILLPNSCLDNLVRRHIQWPMLFKLTNSEQQRTTHAGVLEFLAEEGKCYLPSWMMNQLHLIEGDLILVEYKSLPNATYAKFKPMSTDFYHISNPRAMLEVELRKFACLTKGDVIAVQYNDQLFEFQVNDLKPQNAVTIIECDINIEFDTAEGYVEPSEQQEEGKEQKPEEVLQQPDTGFKAFAGSGFRLDGKKPRTISTTSQQDGAPSTSTATKMQQPSVAGPSSSSPESVTANTPAHLAPILIDENYVPGKLRFVRSQYKNRATLEKEAREEAEQGTAGGPKPFSGKGNTIRPMKK